MKKVLPITLLIPTLLLASCANHPSVDSSNSENPSEDVTSSENVNSSENETTTESTPHIKTIEEVFEEKLNLLKVGYLSDNLVSESYYPKENPNFTTTDKYLNQTSAIKDKFSYKLYHRTEDPTVSPIVGAFETIYNENGDACSGRLNINNEVSKYQILHPTGNGVFRFVEDGYQNFFTMLDKDDFTKTSSRTFTLKKQEPSLNNAYKAIGTQMYANPGFTIKHFSIYLDENYNLEATTIFNTFEGKSYNYNYTFESKIKPISIDEFEDRNIPLPTINDEYFDNAINKLKAYNFTLTQQDFKKDGTVRKTSTLLMNNDKFYSTTLDSNNRKMSIGMYKDGENYQTVTKNEQGEYLKGNIVTDIEFAPYFPSFKINRSVFDKNGNVYTLKKAIDGDPYVFTPYETEASELNRTTFEINQDSIVITNIFGKDEDKLVVTFTNLGTTDVGFTKDDIIDPSDASYTWQDILKPENIDHLKTLLNNDLSLLPCPQGLKDRKAWSFQGAEGIAQIFYASASMPAEDKVITQFNSELVKIGWSQLEGEEIPAFSKQINGKTIIVQAFIVGNDLQIQIFDSALLG